MEVKHLNFDALVVSYQGRICKKARKLMHDAKTAAKASGDEELFEFNGVSGLIKGHGNGGAGWAFIINTGDDRETWLIKDSDDPGQWNIQVSVRAIQLASVGYEGAKKRIYEVLEALGAITLKESINRIDIAIDVLAEGFQPEPEKMIYHSRTKLSRHYEAGEEGAGDYVNVIGNRNIESLTIGKLPGRQIQIYDKRKECIAKRKGFWFELWGYKGKDDCPQIWRTEVRFGKKYLYDNNISSFADLEKHLGFMLGKAFEDVRMVEKVNQTNVTRSKTHSFWAFCQSEIVKILDGAASLFDRERILSVSKREYNGMLEAQFLGVITTWAASRGVTVAECLKELPGAISGLIGLNLEMNKDRFAKKHQKAVERLSWCRFAGEGV